MARPAVATGVPFNVTCPVSGTSRPAMTLSKVVLPHPLGPRMTVASRRDLQGNAVERTMRSEELADVRQRDRRYGHLASRSEAYAPSAATGTKTTRDCSSASAATFDAGVFAMIV